MKYFLELYILPVISFFTKAWIWFSNKNDVLLAKSQLFKVTIKVELGNKLDLNESRIKNTFISIKGERNIIQVRNGLIGNSIVSIQGENNRLIIDEGVILRKADIIIRGNNCEIIIGKKSTFGGVRIVNVGKDNNIVIGHSCLFSDHIEIWASDTHPIYNANNECINKEKPIIIGNSVWVGSRVIILKGLRIGNGSVIGMGSIVTKNIPDNSVNVGSPNKTITEGVHWSLFKNEL